MNLRKIQIDLSKDFPNMVKKKLGDNYVSRKSCIQI